jgi:hypothetical protein
MTKIGLALFILIFWQNLAANSIGDLAREQRLREEIQDMILDGEPITLTASDTPFLSIFTDAEEPRLGALIIHGRGFHPDWEDVVNPLRVGLLDYGVSTLSLQMPVLEKGAKYYDYVPLFDAAALRIESGISYLREQGLEHIVLIAHSCGAHMAMRWMEDESRSKISAFVGLGMGATDFGQFIKSPFVLDKFSGPILDLYGENEFPSVIKMAPQRLVLMKKAGNEQSVQRVLPNADHYFKDVNEPLVKTVGQWLESLRL